MSGKRSKKIRKSKGFSKKAVAGAAVALLCATPIASEGGEFLLSLYPKFSFPVIKFDDSLSTGFGGGLRLTYRPTNYFNVFLQGDYKQYSFDTKEDIGNLSVLGGTVGAGWHLSITDRVGLNVDAGVGYYNSTYSKGKGSQKTSIPINGFNVEGSVSVSYKLGPVVSVYGEAGADHYAYKNAKFLTSVDANPGLTVNLTKAFTSKSDVQLGEQSLKPVFPVFYSWYNDNSFGDVEIINGEDASITDVTVYFYQSQYMSQPQDCGSKAILKKGEKFNVNLKAFFNEQMLSLNEKTDTMSNIIVEYKYLGKKMSKTFPMIVPVYGRNNMSWEDDRCASAFVSSKDPAAMWFSKYVLSTIRDNVRSGVPQNIQYAMAIFEALDQFGINYVKDPTSAFEDNVGTASIDFLQFPYQTLMYRGGDCDDLSILVCSLLESIGIKTAFITIPGHIYMAFDSGLNVKEAQNYFISLDDLIIDGDNVWVPLEITLSDEGFNKAWYKGAWEWNTAKRSNTAMLYRMEDSWKVYKPVNVPGAVANFTLPEEVYVSRLFSHAVDEFVLNQITPQIAYYENLLVKAPTAQNYNDFGVLYAKYGLFENAEKQFRVARSMNYTPAVLNTANLYYSIKDYSRAENWYKEVLSVDSSSSLAMIGLARCAYEKNDYNTCDYYYGRVYNSDYALAKQYSYLGAFEQTSGRSFSLADRLENTVWVQSADYGLRNATNAGNANPAAESVTAVAIEDAQPVPQAQGIEPISGAVAIVPAGVEEISEETEEEQTTGAGDGTGEGDGDGDNTQETYVGISSQLDFNILTAKDLADLASETIALNGETLDDFDAESFSLEVKSDSGIVEEHDITDDMQGIAQSGEGDKDSDTFESQSVVTSVMTDVPVHEVPRFTEQPSEEWAPAEAYTFETIPGMRSFDEEMGNYQNDKAFLYKDEFSFAINPGETAKEETSNELDDSNALEVNPFSSFLTESESAKMEQITSFKLEVPPEKPKAETATTASTTKTAATVKATTTAAKLNEIETKIEEVEAKLEQVEAKIGQVTSSVALREPQGPQSSPQEPHSEVVVPEPVEGPAEAETVAAEAKTVVPEPVEGLAEADTAVAKADTVATEPKKQNKAAIAIIFAAIAGGVGAIFGLKKKNKRKGK